MDEVKLAEIKPIFTPKGHVYLYIPDHVKETCQIRSGNVFVAKYSDGTLTIKQEVR